MKITDTIRRVETLSVDEVRRWLAEKRESDYALIDVREPEEYSQKHLPGALLIPLSDLLDRLDEFDPAKPVILYCSKGMRSKAAASLLKGRGLDEAYSIEGGINAWEGYVATGAYETGMFLFEGKTTVEELFRTAWALENGTNLYYKKAGELVRDEEIKQLFTFLATAEERHKAIIIKTYRKIKGIGVKEEFYPEEFLKGFMEGGVSVEETLAWLKAKDRTIFDFLELAMQIETNSLDLYLKVLHEIEDEDTKRVFHVLIDEEKKHLSQLGKLLGMKMKNEETL